MTVPPQSLEDGPVASATLVPGDGATRFESSVGASGSSGRAVDGGSAGSTAGPPSTGTDNGARAISEADILAFEGDRLYALSRYSGLSVVDVSDPANLRLLGTYRSAAEPFEMYVEDGRVFALFNSWYSRQCDDATGVCAWQTTSRMQALDLRDPAKPELLADVVVPGSISDSRRVGDILYLATEESGYCWGCGSQPSTTLTSFEVADPVHPHQVDQLRLPSPAGVYTSGRSISVTDQRIYISGWEWRADRGSQAGSVQVVDITDPGGALVEGAHFDIAGQVQSRWQMDEYDGVLRVISQPGGWGGGAPAVLETFRVHTADDIQPAGRLSITLARPNEVLQSARFDGARAFAVTAERRDPIFTFDLSDPEQPRQLGELEMPGWIYHIEPRGDRLYALGFDPGNPEGSLHVSAFDVSDLTAPQLRSRVAFGGDWGSFAEDQDRIHKAFTILPEQQLILVPFSAGSYDAAACEYQYSSGIQLIDVQDAALVRRGVAAQLGTARRALLHRERLLGIGDNAVQAFDITDRDQPRAIAELDVARNVTTLHAIGDDLMRFGNDWATHQTLLDVTPLAAAEQAQPAAEIDLSELFGEDTWSCDGSASWGGEVFTHGDYAYVPRYTSARAGAGYEQRLTFYVVDLSDRAAPRAIGSFSVEPAAAETYFAGILQTENTLLVGRSSGYFRYDSAGGILSRPSYAYDIIDLSNASSPSVASRLELPDPIAGGGWGYFVGGCTMDLAWGWGGYYPGYRSGSAVALTDGDLVVSQHAVQGSSAASSVEYYLDRIDVSDPRYPRVLPAINIPGTVVHFSAARSELVTLDYERSIEPGSSYLDCNRGAYGSYSVAEQACEIYRRSLSAISLVGGRALRRSQLLLDRTRRVGEIAVSDDRIFYTTVEFPPPGSDAVGTGGAATAPVSGASSGVSSASAAGAPSSVTLETIELSGGQLTRLPSLELRRERNGGWYSGQLFARGERAFEIQDNTLTAVDTSSRATPTRLTHEIPGWACQSLEVAGDTAFCALGQRGVEAIDLSPLAASGALR